MKIKMTVELEFVDNLIDWNDVDEVNWLKDEILPNATVILFSDEIGDQISKNKFLENIEIEGIIFTAGDVIEYGDETCKYIRRATKEELGELGV